MAEAFPEKDEASHQTLISLSSMTECPVCLETLRKPRSLPCHHTFCLECLETYITKVTSTEVEDDTHASSYSLLCPVCRTLVLPPTSPVDSRQWASQFPTNSFVLGILEKRNKDKEETCMCSPCHRQNKDVGGTLFCMQCSFFMCTSCKSSFHDILFIDHHVVSSTDGKHKTKQTISDQILCERHGEKMEYVCLDHAVIECYKCVIADHRQCLKVVPLMEYAAEIREKDQVTETLSDLARGSQDMTALVEAFELHTGGMKDNEDAVIQELEDMLKLFIYLIYAKSPGGNTYVQTTFPSHPHIMDRRTSFTQYNSESNVSSVHDVNSRIYSFVCRTPSATNTEPVPSPVRSDRQVDVYLPDIL